MVNASMVISMPLKGQRIWEEGGGWSAVVTAARA